MMFYYQDTPINYKLSGQGPALVFLHGFLESSTIWKEIAPSFEPNRTVVTVDLPGHGESGVLQSVHSMELMANVVKALLDQLEIETATFIGHSMGGYVCLAFAELYPESVQALVLMNSTPKADSPERIVNRKRALKIMERNAQAFISMAISNLFTSEEQKLHAPAIEQLKKEALQMEVAGVTAAIRGMIQRKNRTSVLKQFNKKTTMILGEEDPIMEHSENLELAVQCDAIPVSVKGGHMSWISVNKEIVKILHLIV